MGKFKPWSYALFIGQGGAPLSPPTTCPPLFRDDKNFMGMPYNLLSYTLTELIAISLLKCGTSLTAIPEKLSCNILIPLFRR
jgi:hypothetical protein